MARFRGSRRVRWVQVLINRFFKTRRLSYRPLVLDGRVGDTTEHYIRLARHYLGVGPNSTRQSAEITDDFIRQLKEPRRRLPGTSTRRHRARLVNAGRRQAARKRRVKAARKRRAKVIKGTSAGAPHWGGSRYVCQEGWRAAGSPAVYSTKRGWGGAVNGNNASDHNYWNRTAYAIDSAPGDSRAAAIGRHYGVRRVGTYTPFFVRRDGRVYRCQLLWRVPGHHDHTHLGARR